MLVRKEQKMSPVATPQLTTRDLYTALDTYVRFGEDLFSSSMAVASGGFRRASHLVSQRLLGPWNTEELAAELFAEYRDTVTAMASVGPVAAANAARRLAKPSRATLNDFSVSIDGAAPIPHGHTYWIGGKPLLMPVRITDASEAWALWFVPAEAAQEKLGQRGDLLRVVDFGGGRTSLTLFAVEYRHTDLGRYLEMALGLCVVPRNDSAAPPGLTSITMAVNHDYTREAARAVWGIEKHLAPHMVVAYEEEDVRFRLAAGQRSCLSVLYPRLRSSRSIMVPMPLYSTVKDDEGRAVPLRATIQRKGEGEGMQVSGSVRLLLGDETAGGCCLGSEISGSNCFCRILRDLGVTERLPAANGWTEQMVGSLSAPDITPFNHSETSA
jgi:hypothetical protein